ncbi:unnamed protein product [Caenorhabditis nigoni]
MRRSEVQTTCDVNSSTTDVERINYRTPVLITFISYPLSLDSPRFPHYLSLICIPSTSVFQLPRNVTKSSTIFRRPPKHIIGFSFAL